MTGGKGRDLVWFVQALQLITLPTMLAVPAYVAAVRTIDPVGTGLRWYHRVEIAALSLVLGVMLTVLAWAGLVVVGRALALAARLARRAGRR